MLEKELWQRIPSSPAGKQGDPAAFHRITMIIPVQHLNSPRVEANVRRHRG